MWLERADKAGGSAPGGAELEAFRKLAEELGGGERLLCFLCGNLITWGSARSTIDGAHEHTRENPSGLVFHIGCFREAPGCGVVGEPSDDYPWFPGYLWQIAVCRGCRAHLGWLFQCQGDVFFGLILSRLTRDDSTSAP
jgi:hypothetical protein